MNITRRPLRRSTADTRRRPSKRASSASEVPAEPVERRSPRAPPAASSGGAQRAPRRGARRERQGRERARRQRRPAPRGAAAARLGGRLERARRARRSPASGRWPPAGVAATIDPAEEPTRYSPGAEVEASRLEPLRRPRIQASPRRPADAEHEHPGGQVAGSDLGKRARCGARGRAARWRSRTSTLARRTPGRRAMRPRPSRPRDDGARPAEHGLRPCAQIVARASRDSHAHPAPPSPRAAGRAPRRGAFALAVHEGLQRAAAAAPVRRPAAAAASAAGAGVPR